MNKLFNFFRNMFVSADVVLLEENFIDILPNDERFRKVRVVLCNASCSKSGVTSAI
jgi:hypothetical protein